MTKKQLLTVCSVCVIAIFASVAGLFFALDSRLSPAEVPQVLYEPQAYVPEAVEMEPEPVEDDAQCWDEFRAEQRELRGAAWRELQAEREAQLLEAYEAGLIESPATAFVNATGEAVSVAGVRQEPAPAANAPQENVQAPSQSGGNNGGGQSAPPPANSGNQSAPPPPPPANNSGSGEIVRDMPLNNDTFIGENTFGGRGYGQSGSGCMWGCVGPCPH